SRGKRRIQRKLAFPHGGKEGNSENQLSLTMENKKSAKIGFPSRGKKKETAKNGFPSRGKRRIQRKLAFPHGGKQENSEKQLSLTREKKETAKNGFPPRGKTRIQ
ncbi:MAG: hypothetical protein ACTTJ9_09360, partial [Segatella oris]